MTLPDIIDEVKKLSRDEQVDLLDEIYVMLNTDRGGVVLTAAQAEDLDRRIEEYRAGKAKMIPGDQAIAELRKRIRCATTT